MPHGPSRAQSKSLPRGGSRCRPSFLSLSLSLSRSLSLCLALARAPTAVFVCPSDRNQHFPSPLPCGPRKLRKLTPYVWHVARCTVRRCLSRGRNRRRRGHRVGLTVLHSGMGWRCLDAYVMNDFC